MMGVIAHFFLLLVNRMSELSRKYDYPLRIVPALIRFFFKYDISIQRMDNY